MPYVARQPRTFWIDTVERFEQSDMTQAQFAAYHDLKLSTFRNWLYRLRDEAAEAQTLSQPRFVEVTCADAASNPMPLRIRMGVHVVLELAALPSPAYLAALASALEGGTC